MSMTSAPVKSMTVKVLVVCLGNICRSPMGEAVLKDISLKRGLDIKVDSAGTAGYHEGEDPDERTVAVCNKHQVPISCTSRQITSSDFKDFTHILAADESNLRDLMRKKPNNSTADIRLWGSYLDNESIPDPYYGRRDGFEVVFQQCTRLSNAFLDDVFGKNDPGMVVETINRL